MFIERFKFTFYILFRLFVIFFKHSFDFYKSIYKGLVVILSFLNHGGWRVFKPVNDWL